MQSKEYQNTLRRCPFCGGEAEPRYLYCRPYIICSKCHAQIPCHNTYPKAVEAWNTRKPMDKVVEQLEEKADYEPVDFDYGDVACTAEQRFIALEDAIEIVKGGVTNG